MDDIQRNGFHSHGGLYFRRGSDGSVTVYAEQPGEVTLTAESWASVVASVSQHGEGHLSYHSALSFHVGADE